MLLKSRGWVKEEPNSSLYFFHVQEQRDGVQCLPKDYANLCHICLDLWIGQGVNHVCQLRPLSC